MSERQRFERFYEYDLQEVARRADCPTLCLGCGYEFTDSLGTLPWGSVGVDPTYNFCPCCGVEFGVGDFTFHAVKDSRAAWVGNGCPWFKPALRPAEWDATRQLALLPERVKKVVGE